MFHRESPLSVCTCTCCSSFTFGANVESGGGGIWIGHCTHWSNFGLNGAIVLHTWSTFGRMESGLVVNLGCVCLLHCLFVVQFELTHF